MAVLDPCEPWATVADVTDSACAGDPCLDLDAYVLADALADASFLLNAWSAFAYNQCETTVRPCAAYGPAHGAPEWVPPAGAVSWGMWPYQYATAAGWGGPWWWDSTWGYCGCTSTTPLSRRGDCAGGPSQIGLGAAPVFSVSEVLVDGAVVPAADYRVDDRRWLVRLPTTGTTKAYWPSCQRLDLPATETGTFQVTFTYGNPPPETGVRAAIDLACQIATERCAGECTIPTNVTQLSREGVQIALVRPSEAVLDNYPLSVRAFLNAVNPGGLRRRPRVFSPDLPREVVTTTWP